MSSEEISEVLEDLWNKSPQQRDYIIYTGQRGLELFEEIVEEKFFSHLWPTVKDKKTRKKLIEYSKIRSKRE